MGPADNNNRTKGFVIPRLVLNAELAGWSLTLELLSLKVDCWSKGLGFNLCIVRFPNICVPDFKLESLWLEWSELVRGWLRVDGG